MQYLGLLFYTAVTGGVLVFAQLDTLSSLFLLVLFPLAYFWRRLHMHARVVFIVAAATIASVVGFEVVARVYGMWYTVPMTPLGLPIEAFVAGFLQALYIIAFYEFFCDDRKSAGRLPRRAYGVAASMLVIATILGGFYLLPQIFISYAFLLTLLTSNALVALMVGIANTGRIVRHLKKFGLFLLLWLPIAAVYEFVAVINHIRVYGNPSEYLGYVSLLGNILPYEAITLAILSPLWIVTLYELHIDD